jgi:uncharacterized membrane protein SpoIIM required for sporulation
MVLEHIFPEDWLERKEGYAVFLGIGYSFIGIVLAKVLFPSDPALVSVAFTSILLLPELYKMFSLEEREQGKEERFSIKELIRDNYDFYLVYLNLFLGIMLTYALMALFLPTFELNTLFREQLEFRMGGSAIHGLAIGSDLFWLLLTNNFLVLIACFLVSLFTGDGAIFLITWNASLWGTVFSVTAREAGSATATSPILYFVIIMATVLPHVILEASSYILAAISGGIISKDVLLERFDTERFNRVFFYNFVIFLIALVVLLIGAGVETYVLENSVRYKEIVAASYQ